MKIGGVMGLVGGVGGLVNNAFGEAAGAGVAGAIDQTAAESARLGVDAGGNAITDAAGNLTGAAANGATDALDVSGSGLDQMSNIGDPSSLTANSFSDAATNAQQVTGTTDIANTMPTQPTSAMQQSASVTGSTAAPAAPSSPVTGVPTGQATPTASAAPEAPAATDAPGYNAAQDSQAYNNTLPNGGNAPASSTDYMGKISSWMGNNKGLVNTGVKLVGGMLQGMQQQANFDTQFNYTKDQNARAGQFATNYQAKPMPTGIINSQLPRV